MSDYENNCDFDYSLTYYKVIGNNHGQLEYKEGIIQDTIPFNPTGTCNAGGIYFTTLDHIYAYYPQYGEKIAEVKIPGGTPVYLDLQGNKWKAPQIEIIRFLTWKEIAAFGLLSEEQKRITELDEKSLLAHLQIFKDEDHLFRFVSEDLKTEEICNMVVKQCGNVLRFIPEHVKTIELCCVAVNQSCDDILYVPYELQAEVIAAIQKHPYGKYSVRHYSWSKT